MWGAAAAAGLVVVVVMRLEAIRRKQRGHREIAFFHPYCDNGGGGERVLWILIAHLLKTTDENHRISIYNGGQADKGRLLQLVNKQFHVDLTQDRLADRISLVNIRSRTLLEARWYPVATMILQCLVSWIVGIECLARLIPDVYIDTTGAAFTYPLFALAGCRVAAYVHYPIISSDMLQLVREQRPSYNNAGRIASSVSISGIKLLYYRAVAVLYSLVGACAAVVMVNSSWTENHVASLWRLESTALSSDDQRKRKRRLWRVYPPCNTSQLQSISLSRSGSVESRVLSIGQFRPEKDHQLQLRAWHKFRLARPNCPAKLILMGSTRHQDDDAIVASLRVLAVELSVADSVEFVVNAPYERVYQELSQASVGLHTMWNEHFGISIVEMMAAGLVVIAHDSGGPKMDIVVPANRAASTAFAASAVGYLAATAEEYSLCLSSIFDLTEPQRRKMRERARVGSRRFSDEAFAAGAMDALAWMVVQGPKKSGRD